MPEVKKFEIKLNAQGFGSVLVDGQNLSWVTGITLRSKPGDMPKLLIDMDLHGDIKVVGEGQVQLNSTVLDEDLARQIYKQLKGHFEEINQGG